MTIWNILANDDYNNAFLIDENGKQRYENGYDLMNIQIEPFVRELKIEIRKNGFSDIMNYWGFGGTVIVSSKVKKLIETHFADISIQFLPCHCKQFPSAELWILNVLDYHDVLDISKCDYKYSHNITGEEVIRSIKKYSFIEKAFEYDMFKVCLPNRKLVTSLFVSDRFKAIMKENGVTGLNLKPVYSI